VTYELETETTYDAANPEAYHSTFTPEQLAALGIEKPKRKTAVRKGKVSVRAKEKPSSRACR
jgi:hypothetical protein